MTDLTVGSICGRAFCDRPDCVHSVDGLRRYEIDSDGYLTPDKDGTWVQWEDIAALRSTPSDGGLRVPDDLVTGLAAILADAAEMGVVGARAIRAELYPSLAATPTPAPEAEGLNANTDYRSKTALAATSARD